MSQVKGINPGRLNRRITIMRYQAIEDELGNQVQQLVPLKSCWAEIRQIRGKEQLEYYKNVNELVYKITLRYTDVTEKMLWCTKDGSSRLIIPTISWKTTVI